MREFTEQELVRREKAQALLEKNIDPFGQNVVVVKQVFSIFKINTVKFKSI